MATEYGYLEDGFVYASLLEDATEGYTEDGFDYAYLAAAGGPADQTLTGSAGIASEETFGSGGTVTLMSQVLTGANGEASAENFPATGIVAGPVTGAAGISSGETFGSGGAVATVLLLGVTGIVSEETFGSGGSVGSVGGPVVGLVGIPSTETFGTGGSVAGPILGATGIASAEAFGTGLVAAIIYGASGGIPSAEAFGVGSVQAGIAGLIGIPSAEAFGSSGFVISLNHLTGYFAIFIDGDIRSQYVTPGSIKIQRQLNFQGAASFSLVAEVGVYTPAIGEEVIILYYRANTGTWERKFAGSIDDITTFKEPFTTYLRMEVSLVTFDQALARRVINRKFPATEYGTVSSIMKAISDSILVAEGLTYVNRGDPGVVLGDIEFNYMQLNEALNTLADLGGWNWATDFYRNVYMYDRPSYIQNATFAITEDTVGANADIWRDLTVLRSRGLYRNRQYIKASFTATTTTVTETYAVGLNETVPPYEYQKFYDGIMLRDLRYTGRVSEIKDVQVNGVSVPWYYMASETGGTTPPEDWQYAQIWQNDLELIWNMIGKPGLNPTTGDTLTVVFEMLNDMPEPVMEEDAVEILARQAIEGGSGVYEAVEEVSDIQDRTVLVEYAKQLLARFKVMGLEVNLTTFREDLEPGMSIDVNLPSYGIPVTTTMIVESMEQVDQEDDFTILTTAKISNLVQQRDALTALQKLIRRLSNTTNKNQSSITFDLATTYPGVTNPGLVVGTNMTNEYLIRVPTFTLREVAISMKTAPTGADVEIDIKANGVSIFATGEPLVYPANSTSTITRTVFRTDPLTLTGGYKLSLDILAVGSGVPGKDCTVTVTGWV